MNKYDFDAEALHFDIEELIKELEKEHGRMIVRIPKMKQTALLEYSFTAIFSDFSLLEADMLIVPFRTSEGYHAQFHIVGAYL